MSMKEKILEILEENKGKSISGSFIAQKLGITRSAVWKTVKTLKEEGYIISAVTNKGYCLAPGSDILSEQSIKPLLKTHAFGKKMDVFKSIDSTNNFAKSLAQIGGEHGTVIIAESQTKGRGRLNRNFYSPGGGVYMSIILRPELSMEDAQLITSCAAAAVARAIQNITGLDAKIKWVNDIFIGGKKVCGILTEAGMNFETGKLDYAVVGIGINVNTKHFSGELEKIATSLFAETGKTVLRCNLIAEILNVFEQYFEKMHTREFMSEYISRSNVIGREVTVTAPGVSYSAVVVGIDQNARLLVKTQDGEEHILNSGEISVRF